MKNQADQIGPNNRRGKTIVNIVVLVGLLALILATALTPGHPAEDYLPACHATVLALLPPIVAIALALLTREVYSSLFVGVAVGALLYASGNAELALNTMLYHPDGGLVPNLTDISHASVLVFVTLLGTLVVLMNRSGGAAAFGRWASTHIKTRTGAQLATIAMGLLIFVDDGFNCMTVGSVMRPMTDSHRVSRAKLAYLLDSTAAPVCIIAPISCWAAAVSYAVPPEYGINGFRMFLRAIPYDLARKARLHHRRDSSSGLHHCAGVIMGGGSRFVYQRGERFPRVPVDDPLQSLRFGHVVHDPRDHTAQAGLRPHAKA